MMTTKNWKQTNKTTQKIILVLFLIIECHYCQPTPSPSPGSGIIDAPVFVKIDLENVVHVDDKSPGVQLDLTVIMVWRNSDFGDDDDSDSTGFKPQVLFANLDLSMRQPDVSPRQNIFRRGDGWSQLSSRIVAIFSQFFFFKEFPFDTQDVFIILQSEPGVQYFLYKNESQSPIPHFNHLTTEDWVPTTTHTTNFITSKEVTFFEGTANLSEYVMEFRVKRESDAYVVTNIIPGFFAVFVSTSQVFLNIEKYFSVRVSISVWSLVLLSNLQSFPFSIIPRGEFVNYLEIFGLCNYILMITNFFELMIAQWFETHGHQNWRRGLDITARWLLPSFVILVNVAILIYFPGESWRGLVIWLTLAGPFVVVVMVYIAHRKIVNMNEEERKPMLVNE